MNIKEEKAKAYATLWYMSGDGTMKDGGEDPRKKDAHLAGQIEGELTMLEKVMELLAHGVDCASVQMTYAELRQELEALRDEK